MNTDMIILIATLVMTLTGIICAYYAYKSYATHERGRPKEDSQEHKIAQTLVECDISTESNVTVNMKITALMPGSEDGYLHK